MCCKKSFDDFALGGNLVGAWRFKEVMPTMYFGNPTLYPFENTEINGVEFPDLYLSHQYGDWRTLPPEDKRVTHHDFFLDLKKGYIKI